MKLAVDANEVTYDEIEALVSDDLIQRLSDVVKLSPSNEAPLRETLKDVYDEFMSGYYTVEDALPEHEESEALMDVYDAAVSLNRAMNDLLVKGKSDKRLAESLERHDSLGIWEQLTYDKCNPNIDIRRLIGNLAAASLFAADKKPEIKDINLLQEQLKSETNPKRQLELETEIALEDFINHIYPNQQEEYKNRVKARKTPKDLPLRVAIKILKEFIEKYTDMPFTAGKYYPEIGFKSPVFYFVKIVLEQVVPEVSERKIASLMQSLSD